MRQRLKLNALRTLPPAVLLIAALASGAPPAAALSLDSAEAAIGQWDISLAPGAKTCRLTLRGEAVHGGYFVGVPPACRHAMPVLASVSAWILPGANHLDLADVYGMSLLDFAEGEGGHLTAFGPQGETYRLTFVAPAPPPRGAEPTAAPRAAAAQATGAAAPPVAPRAIVRPGDVPGRYAVLRDAGRDTGCMVTLGDSGNRAFLSPACRDQGIVIFDPAGWRIVAGRLVLTARKGHKTEFDLQPDGAWMKDAKDGKSLTLKKL